MGGKLKVNELFSGIGAQHKALERIGIDYEIVGIVDVLAKIFENLLK